MRGAGRRPAASRRERRDRADVGHDLYRVPGQAQPQPLTAETNVPVNTIIDATNGRMGIESVNGAADFYGGKFVIREPKRQPVTQLWLAGPDPRSCTAQDGAGRAPALGRRQGPLPDAGRYASATVRGTTVARAGSLRRDADDGRARRRRGARLRRAPHGARQRGAELSRAPALTRVSRRARSRRATPWRRASARASSTPRRRCRAARRGRAARAAGSASARPGSRRSAAS